MEIKILGPGCAKCEKTAKLVQEVVAETGAQARVVKVTDMMQIAGSGVVSTPAVMVDGEIKSTGKVPKKGEIAGWLK
ncbi:MAG: thioredoxin family protein [Desulfobacteraceae bacterium]|nr:thioredoxin family protein [Desulfobacteraceae bacterium]MBC2753325.1 TM0996/MTH895 family glutaredoxin-like protein [Desulfobacteraceae bacterium]